MTDEQKRDRTIEAVMQNFNFDKVHTAMVAVNWVWNDKGVPTRDEVVATARRLLEEAWERKGTIRTGGFQATYIGPDETEGQGDYCGELQLLFWLERAYIELNDISLMV